MLSNGGSGGVDAVHKRVGGHSPLHYSSVISQSIETSCRYPMMRKRSRKWNRRLTVQSSLDLQQQGTNQVNQDLVEIGEEKEEIEKINEGKRRDVLGTVAEPKMHSERDERERKEGEYLECLLPTRKVIGPVENGIKKVDEKLGDDGSKVKISTNSVAAPEQGPYHRPTTTATPLSKKNWHMFGNVVHKDAETRFTMFSIEEVLLEHPEFIEAKTVEEISGGQRVPPLPKPPDPPDWAASVAEGVTFHRLVTLLLLAAEEENAQGKEGATRAKWDLGNSLNLVGLTQFTNKGKEVHEERRIRSVFYVLQPSFLIKKKSVLENGPSSLFITKRILNEPTRQIVISPPNTHALEYTSDMDSHVQDCRFPKSLHTKGFTMQNSELVPTNGILLE